MEPWRTSIVDSRDGHIRIRGYEVPSLMTGRTFTDTIFLLHQGRLPSECSPSATITAAQATAAWN